MSPSRGGPPRRPGGGDEAAQRLQKVLARAGVASRRKVEELIREGRITVNGQLAELGQRVDLAKDAVKVDGKRVFAKTGDYHYVLLNKPAGCVSTRRDPEGRATVVDLLPPGLRRDLVPVGRLDYETEGLLILTDDGDFAQHVAHPRYGCVKTYEAKVKGRPKETEIAKLRRGVLLDGKLATPISITSRPAPSGPRESVSNSWWTVQLGEGRTRQIREMFFRIGHPVSRLRRVAIGPVADGRLPRGAWRELTEKEVELLRRKTERPVAAGKAGGRSKKAVSAQAGPAKAAAAKGRRRKSEPAKARPGKTRPAKGTGGSRPPMGSRPSRGRGPAGGGKGRRSGPQRGGPKRGGTQEGRAWLKRLWASREAR